MSPRRQAPPGQVAEAGAGSATVAEVTSGTPTAAEPGAGAGAGAAAAAAGGAVAGGRGALPTRVPASKQRGRARAGSGSGSGAASRGGARAGSKSSRPGGEGGAAAGGATAAAWATESDADATEQAAGLSARLMALARMIQIGTARSGRDGFSKKLLSQAEDVLGRAGERMRLSSAHTVVVLAGGTGSGKSSLFNRLAGAEFSTVGVTRPITKESHACIWDDSGSGALLEWLGVPQRYRYSRASALDGGESGLAGLVLLDLPDHDSVMGHATGQVDRLVSLADVMIWVLDPQKYADAAVHQRFLIPLAGHSDVQAVVLNQADLLTAAQIDDCVGDLRRLLDAEDLQDVPILVTSAVTGSGLDELRRLLAEGVAARRAAAARISADVSTVVERFAPYAGEADEGSGPAQLILAGSIEKLVDQFYAAAGVTAVGDALRSARELRAADFVGWPVAWIMQRLTGRDPLRQVRLGLLWNDLRAVSSGPAGAQQAGIDNALTEFGDKVAEPLIKPWSQTVRAAARSRADAIPPAVGEAIGAALPAEDSVERWWRMAGLAQGVLLGAAAVALAWFAAIVVFGVFNAVSGLPSLLSDPLSMLWAVLLAVAALGLGIGTASVSMNVVKKRAQAENVEVLAEIRKRVQRIAKEMAVAPVEQELSEFDRYREEYAVASKEAST
ncbi:MAG TPA: GTPase [Streptosporangiaceae bacterium]|nr:GTPase [Streptosporangiaceae bacterium]